MVICGIEKIYWTFRRRYERIFFLFPLLLHGRRACPRIGNQSIEYSFIYEYKIEDSIFARFYNGWGWNDCVVWKGWLGSFRVYCWSPLARSKSQHASTLAKMRGLAVSVQIPCIFLVSWHISFSFCCSVFFIPSLRVVQSRQIIHQMTYLDELKNILFVSQMWI